MIHIGIVGAGGMGLVHIKNYAHIAGCRVVALCDSNERAKETADAHGLHYYTQLQDMLMYESLSAVDICTPTFLHKSQVETALLAGVHVLCEKPLCLSSIDACSLIALAANVKKLLLVGQVVQYMPQTNVLRELIHKKTYGSVLDASFFRGGSSPKWSAGNWLFDKASSGLLPFDLHIHDLDVIVSLFGVPNTVAVHSCGNGNATYKEHYRILYNYAPQAQKLPAQGDLQIQAEVAWYHAAVPFTATWRVYFENALVVLEANGRLVAYPHDAKEVVYDTSEAFVVETGINLPPTGMFYAELSDFIKRIENEETGCMRAEDIVSVITLLEKIEPRG